MIQSGLKKAAVGLGFATMTLVGAGSAQAVDHSGWETELQKYVKTDGNVDYKGWQQDAEGLDSYLADLSAVSYASYQDFSANEKKAFLINAYNAFTIKLILDNYPVDSIRDIGGIFRSPWNIRFFSLLDGQIRDLDAIEHKWLRKKPELFDPRVHAVINCASFSCPILQRTAYQPEILDEQMDVATRGWLADSARNSFDVEGQRIQLSEIFRWFKEDFGGDEGIKDFLIQYGPATASEILGGEYRIRYLNYDWSLNE